MAKFCSRCGSLNDESTGLCPVCDREQLAAMQAPQPKLNFCMMCGTPIDPATGNCPNCTQPEAIEPETVPVAEAAPEVIEEPVAAEQPVEEPVIEETPAEEPAEAEEAVAVEEPVTALLAEEPVLEEKPAKKKSGVGRTLLAVFLSILLFLTTMLSLTVVFVRHTTSESGILSVVESVVEDIDCVDVLNNIYSVPSSDPDANYGDESWTFADYLSDYFETSVGVEVSEQQINAFIEDSTIKEFLAEKAADYMSDIYAGTNDFRITRRDVMELLEDNEDVIVEHFDVAITNETARELSEWLVDEQILDEINASVVKEESESVYYALNIGFSYLTMVILLALVALCLIGLALNDLSKGAMGAGIVFTIIGALFTVPSIVVVAVPAVLESLIGEELLAVLIREVLATNLLIFVAILLVGVLMLVTRFIVRRCVRKSRQKKAYAGTFAVGV